jgi:hypothetical protein
MSGLQMQGVSLAMQLLGYQEILCKGKEAWDSSVKVEKGYRAGLSKLQCWLKTSTLPVDNMNQNQLDMKDYFKCMTLLSSILFELKALTDKGLQIDETALTKFALRHKLKCTKQSDAPIVVRMMCEIITEILKQQPQASF